MKKKFYAIVIAFMVAISTTACIPLPLETYDTPEEAIEAYMEEEGFPKDTPYAYTLIDNYMFLLFGDVLTDGRFIQDEGYTFTIPLGSRLGGFSYPSKFVDKQHSLVSLLKNENDYIIAVPSYKEYNGEFVDDSNSALKVYNNKGDMLYPLYVKDSDQDELAFWIDVQPDGLPEDYTVHAEYNGEKVPLTDAEQIKKEVG